MSWEMVDEGWGRRAVEFATLSEPSACREYVAVHHRLGIGVGDRLLDVACGSGLAIELATVRGANCAGIDASPRLAAVANDRNPDCDIRVGDMGALPWDGETFDVVTVSVASGERHQPPSKRRTVFSFRAAVWPSPCGEMSASLLGRG